MHSGAQSRDVGGIVSEQSVKQLDETVTNSIKEADGGTPFAGQIQWVQRQEFVQI